MRMTFLDDRTRAEDQWVPGLGFLRRDGFNFLPSIVRLEEILSGALKT